MSQHANGHLAQAYGTCESCNQWDRARKCETGHSLGLGRCMAIPMFYDATEWNDDGEREFTERYSNTKAFAQDASDYRAVVLTRPDFGCVSWVGGSEK